MAEDGKTPARDLRAGVPLSAFETSAIVAGQVDGEDAMIVRTAGGGLSAIGARCTHNGADLTQGTIVHGAVRCPWHHACFDLRTGAALAAPALRAVPHWSVEEADGTVRVAGERQMPARPARSPEQARIVIVGAGAAGSAAADALARLGHGHRVTLIGHEPDAPYDRTMLTKHFLSGQAGEEGLPLGMDDLRSRGVDLRLATTVVAIDADAKRLRLADGVTLPFDKLILATGAEPKSLTVPGAELPHVRVLRSVVDARGIIAALAETSRVVVAGSSFIGLEAAAALRDRDVEVTVVSPDQHPFARVFGPTLSEAILGVHRKRGTGLRLGRQVTRIEPDHVELDDGSRLPADLVVVGIGVSPRTALAEEAGLAVRDGVIVDAELRTSHPDIFAAGDIARWPDPHSEALIRVEHWAVAQRQGQIAAANAAGAGLRYDAVPFFWTLHFDFSARYVGHAGPDDREVVDGNPAAKDASIHLRRDNRDMAVVTVERDGAALDAERAMEERSGAPANVLPRDIG